MGVKDQTVLVSIIIMGVVVPAIFIFMPKSMWAFGITWRPLFVVSSVNFSHVNLHL